MYPSVINTFNIVNPTDRLNSPSHSALHNSVSSVLTQVQTVIGTGSSTLGTIMGDIHNPLSDGGGHVQSASKGGTGQTTYMKGDLLTGLNSSSLGKLAVGVDGQNLIVDSSVASGMKWGSPPGTKISSNSSVIGIAFDTSPPAAYSVMSVTIPASILTNNAVRATAYINSYTGSGGSVLLRAHYGSNQVASIIFRSAVSIATGKIDYTLISTNSGAQRGQLELYLSATQGINVGSIVGYQKLVTGISSVDSGAIQTMGLTMMAEGDSQGNLQVNSYVVEKIS